MDKLKVGVIGAGIFGINHVRAYLSNPMTELVGVCDLNDMVLQEIKSKYNVKTYTSAQEMFDSEELNAVSIATPDASHTEPALLAIEHKVDVLIEKPLATNTDDCRKIIREAEKNQVRIAVDFHKRWDPAVIHIKKELYKGYAGFPIRGYMNMDDVIDVPTTWLRWADQSSPVHFLGIHCYDQIRWYMECEATEVYAVGTKKVLAQKGIDTYDSVQAIITFENGCTWVVENSWIYPSGFAKANDGRTVILTQNALFRNDSQNRGLEIFDSGKQNTPNSYFLGEHNNKPFGFGIDPINDFIDCLINDKKFIADAYDGLESAKIAEAVHLSIEKGESVKIKKEEQNVQI